MGKKFEKHFKENELFCFLDPEEVWPDAGTAGGSDPVGIFGPQNGTKTGSLPPVAVFCPGA